MKIYGTIGTCLVHKTASSSFDYTAYCHGNTGNTIAVDKRTAHQTRSTLSLLVKTPRTNRFWTFGSLNSRFACTLYLLLIVSFPGVQTCGLGTIVSFPGVQTHGLGTIVSFPGVQTRGLETIVSFPGVQTHGLGAGYATDSLISRCLNTWTGNRLGY